jgi:aspartate ammonia-lyase
VRKESDSIGELEVPDNAYYGVQTLRGFEIYPHNLLAEIRGNRVMDVPAAQGWPIRFSYGT